MSTHTILGGKVRLYRRGDGSSWHCAAYYKGREHRKSTKEDSLEIAQEKAEDWYLELRGKARAGLPTAGGKPFGAAADAFITDYEASVEGQRSPKWIAEHKAHIENHLKPFFGKFSVPQIDQDRAQEYRLHRFKNPYIRRSVEGDGDKPKPAPRPTAQSRAAGPSKPMRHNRINKRSESPSGFHNISEPFSGEPASAPLGERGRPGVQPRLPSAANKIGSTAPARLNIRDLNDAFRASIPQGKCIITTAVSKLGMPFSTAAIAAARAFCEFTPENDPDGEHDFGAFVVGEERLCWKIDYYDPTLRFGSRDPSDPAQTKRVLTIMLDEEY